MAEASVGCPRCAELEKRIERLERIIEQQAEKIRDLRARLNLTSRNSSKPPSSDPPSVPPTPSVPAGRKPGRQPGHDGHRRREFRAEEIDHRVEIEPERCEFCKAPLAGVRCQEPDVLQVVEIPPIAAEVT